VLKEPAFPYRVALQDHAPVTRTQCRILWHLAHGAIVETWLGSMPLARMWTKATAEFISARTVSALSEKRLIRPIRHTVSNGKHRGRWTLTRLGKDIVASIN
jgi:hypothetical protein